MINSQDLRRLSMDDFQAKAKEIIEKEGWEYYAYAAGRRWTYQDSINAFERYIIRPRIMRGIGDRDITTTVLGHRISVPICAAPSALHVYAHSNGERESAKGVEESGSLMILSSEASVTIADVAEAAPGGFRWMQTYIFKNRKHTEHIVRQAERAGFKAIVLTVDSPVTVNWDELDDNFAEEGHLNTDPNYRCINLFIDIPEVHEAKASGDINLVKRYLPDQHNSPITWDDFKWLKSITSLPIVCKGILTAEAAKEAVDAGAAGIIVSAHGGRQLDGAPAPIDALAEVVDAVGDSNVEVYLDGGVRSGTDIFKALGRGARAVFLGRPILWGLACGGAAGVKRIFTMLGNELKDVMALSGCPSLHEIPSDMVVHKSYYDNREYVSKAAKTCPECTSKL
nr:uncharacterized protein LOC129253897 [Lytechinus pictus]